MAIDTNQLLGLLLLAAPAVVYYFAVNKDIKKSFSYLIMFFGALFIVRIIAVMAGLAASQWISYISIAVATSIALYLSGDKLEPKNIGWLAGVVIAGQLLFPAMFASTSIAFL